MKKKPRRTRPKAKEPQDEATAAAPERARGSPVTPIRYAPPASAAGQLFSSFMASCADTVERRTAALIGVAASLPASVGARAGRVRAGAHALARSYSRDEREAFALLFLPFLLVASAMVAHQSARMMQSYLAAIAIPDDELPSLAPDATRTVRFAVDPRAAAREAIPARTDLSMVRTGPEIRSTASIGKPLAETQVAGETRALPVTDIRRALDTEGTFLHPVPPQAAPQQHAETTLALLAPLGEAGRSVRPLGPDRPLATLEVDEDGKPVLPGICAIDQVPRTPAPAALTLGETLRPVDAATFGLRLAKAAESQVGSFVVYNDSYRSISYPMGDVHGLFGVCTDVVVRAYRALGLDLQVLVHEARSGTGDRSIDHRRTEILRRFFSTQGESLPITTFPEDYRAGDIVTYYRPQNRRTRAHIAIVSSIMAPSGRPMIVHNRGWGPALEDALFVDQITGHYRYRGPVEMRDAGRSTPGAAQGADGADVTARPAAYAAQQDVTPAR